MRMIRNLYDFTMRLAEHRFALPALAAVSFLESSVFPVPPDAMLIPMVLARPRRAFLIAGVCLLSSVLGGLFGYLIGAAAFGQIGEPVLRLFGTARSVEHFMETYNSYGAWAVLFAGITPFPYKIVTILSGATGLSLPIFVVSSIIARGIRFFLVAALLWRYGESAKKLIERHLGIVLTVCLASAAAVYVMVKLL